MHEIVACVWRLFGFMLLERKRQRREVHFLPNVASLRSGPFIVLYRNLKLIEGIMKKSTHTKTVKAATLSLPAFIHSWTKSVYLQTNELFFNSQPALQQQHHVVHKTTRWKMKKHDEIKCTMFPFWWWPECMQKTSLQIYIFSAFAALSTYFIFIHLCFYWMLFNS